MTGNTTNLWLDSPRPIPGARLRLLCVPFAGGGTSFFRTWHLHLPPWVEICMVTLPGRERRLREKPVDNLWTLVDAIAQALAEQRNLPFAFFGHSMGARLAFEIARKLRRDYAWQPVHLFASAHMAPQLPDPDPPIHTLPDDQFLEEVRQYNGIPPEVLESPELLELILPALRADFTANEKATYDSEPPLTCSISAYGGLQDRNVDRPSLEAWREQTSGEFLVRMFPGDHFYIESQQGLFFQLLGRDLTGVIEQVT